MTASDHRRRRQCPKHAVADPKPSCHGTLYALPLQTVAAVSIASVPLGIARAALDAARTLSSSKTPRLGPILLREKPAVQGAVGRAEGMLRSARAFLLEACDDAWRTVETGNALG